MFVFRFWSFIYFNFMFLFCFGFLTFNYYRNFGGYLHPCLSCCIQGLREPKEPLPGSFVLPNLPQKGECLEVRVKHLLTPNEVFAKATGHFLICCLREPHLFFFLSCLVVVFVASRGRKECSRWRDSGRGSDQNQRKHQQSAAT